MFYLGTALVVGGGAAGIVGGIHRTIPLFVCGLLIVLIGGGLQAVAAVRSHRKLKAVSRDIADILRHQANFRDN